VATVQLASIRTYPERMHPPRALYCEFPLGRPLGKPGDPAFQHRVLEAALSLLERPTGPVLEDFPERIADEAETPLACPLPPRHDPAAPPALDEARGLRAAYDRQLRRSGRTNVGHVIGPDEVPDAIAAILRIAEGVPLEAAGLPGDTRSVGLDVRSYYEEAALALADHVPAARQAESWLYRQTETGKALRQAQAALRDAGAPRDVWLWLVPLTQQTPES
jgi:hypothetical protein